MKRILCCNRGAQSIHCTFTGKSGIAKQTAMHLCMCELLLLFFFSLFIGGTLKASLIWHFGHVKTISHYLFLSPSLSVSLYVCCVYVYIVYAFVRSMCVNANGKNRYGNESLAEFLQNLRAQIVNIMRCCLNALVENCIATGEAILYFVCVCVFVRKV